MIENLLHGFAARGSQADVLPPSAALERHGGAECVFCAVPLERPIFGLYPILLKLRKLRIQIFRRDQRPATRETPRKPPGRSEGYS